MPTRTLCVVSRCELGLDSCRNCWFLACHGVLAVGGVCVAAASLQRLPRNLPPLRAADETRSQQLDHCQWSFCCPYGGLHLQ